MVACVKVKEINGEWYKDLLGLFIDLMDINNEVKIKVISEITPSFVA